MTLEEVLFLGLVFSGTKPKSDNSINLVPLNLADRSRRNTQFSNMSDFDPIGEHHSKEDKAAEAGDGEADE